MTYDIIVATTRCAPGDCGEYRFSFHNMKERNEMIRKAARYIQSDDLRALEIDDCILNTDHIVAVWPEDREEGM